jgi:hypothetical protein
MEITIHRSVKCITSIISNVSNHTTKDLIHSYLSLEAWRFNISEGCYKYGRAIQHLQPLMRRKLLFKTQCHDQVKILLSETMTSYRKELKKSKEKEDKQVIKSWSSMKTHLIEEVIYLYLERCRFKHAMSYLQYYEGK